MYIYITLVSAESKLRGQKASSSNRRQCPTPSHILSIGRHTSSDSQQNSAAEKLQCQLPVWEIQ